MPPIEAVTFDLDDTLVRYERSPGEVLQAAFDRRDLDPLFTVEAYYDRFAEFVAETDSMRELRAECFAALAAENGHDPALGRAVAEAYAAERDQSRVELLPGARSALDDLAGSYRIGVVTNGPPDAQRQKIEAVDLDRWAETTVFAGHETPQKPDPEPFKVAMDALGATPASTVHVGDSLETDVAGAAAVGIDSVWLGGGTQTTEDGGPAPEPTYRIDTLATLPSLLG
jgi:HAD superfamily hydrolase (TIGR01549 family)